MERIGGPLQELLERLRLTEPMEGWEAVTVWPEVVGTRIAARTRAASFRDGVLTVEVDSAAWMNELSYLKRRLSASLNEKLGKEIVREIRLQLGSGPQKPESPGAR